MSSTRLQFAAGTTFSVAPRARGAATTEVRWMRDRADCLSMDLSPAMIRRLRALPTPFGRAEWRRVIAQGRTGGVVLRLLLRRRLVIPFRAGDPRTKATPARAGHREVRWQPSLPTDPMVTEQFRIPGAVALAYVRAAVSGEWHGFGVAPDVEAASVCARGESLERYASLHPELMRTTVRGQRARSLREAPGIMFDYLRATAPARSGRDGAEPQCVVRAVVGRHISGHLPSTWFDRGRSRAVNTNGMAYGLTRTAAIDRAFRELVERDLLLRAWYGLAPSRELDDAVATDRWRGLARAAGLRVRWFLLGSTRSALKTVVCVLDGERPPHFGSGSATRHDLVAAIDKAFLEAAGSHAGHLGTARRLGMRRFVAGALRRPTGRPAALDLMTFERVWAARVPDAMPQLTRRFSRPHVVPPPPLSAARACWIDLTPRSWTRGHVVKVLHQDAVPLPNTMAHVAMLERLLGISGDGLPPPIS